ncbi:glucose PTS transporter subunit IIA [Paenibacillus sp. JCM 10914]|uniref:glucose PTS transporter subunit IIA n=1 Tax=Paenibacillus sp. JCM 10914 TaxID=1236974 RepID=UPI0003CC759D|nr:glucose PTS transporter subunit IIA [Paenibacillus sp. JCM 10914]GAE04054.1 PTS system, glucose-specific IIC component [Paenibacillus sp. JCM 10914]
MNRVTNHGSLSQLSSHIMAALGGETNIAFLDACLSRLRVKVRDRAIVDDARLEQLGAVGVIETGDQIHAVFGFQSGKLKSEIQSLINQTIVEQKMEPARGRHTSLDSPSVVAENIVCPVAGELIDISQVPDPVFAQRMTGDGFAVFPSHGLFVSPVKGKIVHIAPTQHAVAVMSDGGMEVLLHVGVNTVKLRGLGFDVLVQEGEAVKAGQPIMQVDLQLVKERLIRSYRPLFSPTCPKGLW